MDRRSIAVIAAAGLACVAIAVPVSGAFGADDGNGTTGAQQQIQQAPDGYGQPPQGYGQASPGDGQPPRDRPRGDCPKKDQGDSQGQDEGSSDSSAPAPSGDSVAL
jgi:hypothetical protein